ncbi:MAG TPA: hypothetical protein VEJ45_08890 [Candidatus Acidoferrales bacterium]|nr:hypothetical protein [Candidatus Acidoferrales bacterium]
MFEAQQQKETSGNLGMWIGVAVIIVVVAALAYYVMGPKGSSKNNSATSASGSSASVANADAPKDLRVVNVKMDKDVTGNIAVWSVDLRNMSHTYTYKNIAYQTTYLGADNSVLAQNTGTINLSLDPGEEQTTQFRDLLYPSGTAVFKFLVTGASASQ